MFAHHTFHHIHHTPTPSQLTAHHLPRAIQTNHTIVPTRTKILASSLISHPNPHLLPHQPNPTPSPPSLTPPQRKEKNLRNQTNTMGNEGDISFHFPFSLPSSPDGGGSLGLRKYFMAWCSTTPPSPPSPSLDNETKAPFTYPKYLDRQKGEKGKKGYRGMDK